jgi:hypothetical protein
MTVLVTVLVTIGDYVGDCVDDCVNDRVNDGINDCVDDGFLNTVISKAPHKLHFDRASGKCRLQLKKKCSSGSTLSQRGYRRSHRVLSIRFPTFP